MPKIVEPPSHASERSPTLRPLTELEIVALAIESLAEPAAPGSETMPPAQLLAMSTRLTTTSVAVAGVSQIPRCCWLMRTSSMRTLPACSTRMPLAELQPVVPTEAPWMSSPRSVTTSSGCALTVMPLVVEELSTPPLTLATSIVIDLVIATAPSAPGSIALISPYSAVLEIVPASVRQGAVREQGFASSPTPETQVRVAWADAWPPVTAA